MASLVATDQDVCGVCSGLQHDITNICDPLIQKFVLPCSEDFILPQNFSLLYLHTRQKEKETKILKFKSMRKKKKDTEESTASQQNADF